MEGGSGGESEDVGEDAGREKRKRRAGKARPGQARRLGW